MPVAGPCTIRVVAGIPQSRREQDSILAQNLRVEAELRRIVRIFHDAGIDFVILKGVPLAAALHGNLAVRPLGDNDILVRRGDVRAACDALIAKGFAKPGEWTIESALETNHEYTLWQDLPSGRSVVDLHWRVFSPDLYPCDEDVAWQHAIPFSLRGADVLVLDEEFTIISLAVQAATHLFAEKLRFVELALAWEAAGPALRERALRLADETGTRKTLAFCLAVCEALDLLCDVPDGGTWLQPLATRFGAQLGRSAEPPSRALAYAVPLGLVPVPRALRRIKSELFPPASQLSVSASRGQGPRWLGRYLGRIYQLFSR